jgi:hypothetical protein
MSVGPVPFYMLFESENKSEQVEKSKSDTTTTKTEEVKQYLPIYPVHY